MKRAIDEYLTCSRCRRLFEENEGCTFERLTCGICCKQAHQHGKSAASSTIPTLTRDQLREFLLGLPNADPQRIEEGLAHPAGLQTTVPGVPGVVGFIRHGDSYEIVEDFNLDRYNEGATERRVKTAQGVQNMKKLSPCLIIGPALIHDGPAPLGPRKALSLQDEILAKSGTILVKTDRRPFDPNSPADLDAHIEETLARFPGARLAENPKPPMRRYIGQEPNEVIAKACSERPDEFGAVDAAPTVLIATKAETVERPKIEGTISREAYRADIAASEAQAQEVAARCRAQNPSSLPPVNEPAPSGPVADRYVAETVESLVRPGTRLSTSKQSADRDPARGVGPIVYTKAAVAEMNSFHKKIVSENGYRKCATEGCKEEVSTIGGRTKCPAHCWSTKE